MSHEFSRGLPVKGSGAKKGISDFDGNSQSRESNRLRDWHLFNATGTVFSTCEFAVARLTNKTDPF